eukprot:13293781-Ditylum_brightwellii.AAC.1
MDTNSCKTGKAIPRGVMYLSILCAENDWETQERPEENQDQWTNTENPGVQDSTMMWRGDYPTTHTY